MTTKELMTFIGGLVSILGANEALSIHLAPRSIAWRALFEYCRGDQSWGEMTRQRFVGSEDAD